MMNDAPDQVGRPRFMRRPDAAKYLRDKWGIPMATRTLAKLACVSSEGPEMRYAGRFPLYTPEALDRYAERRIGPPGRSTSAKRHHRQKRSKRSSSDGGTAV